MYEIHAGGIVILIERHGEFRMNQINWNNGNVFGNGLNRQEYLTPEPEEKNTVSTLSDFEVSAPPVLPAKELPLPEENNALSAYLQERIGERVLAEFIVGAVQCAQKTGRIRAVGSNFFVLEEENGTSVLCDLSSVKFITFR